MTDLLPFGPGAWTFISLYIASLLLFGWFGYRARRADTLHDFYVAGGGFGMLVMTMTLYATQYSGNSFLGFTGKTYRVGFAWVTSVHLMIAIVVFYLVYAVHLHRHAAGRKYVTPVDFLDERFGSRGLNLAAALIMIFAMSNFLLAQLMAMGRTLQGLAGPHGELAYDCGVVVLAAVMLVYGTLGGMRAVAWTDVVQGGVLMAGFFLLYAVLVQQFGPLSSATATIMAAGTPEALAKLRPPLGDGSREWLSYILIGGMGAALYPQAIQRVYAARSERVLRRSFAAMAVLPFVTAWIAVVAGIYGIAYLPGLEGAGSDQMLAALFRRIQDTSLLGYCLVVVLFSAVLSAIMSTADSILLSISSMLTKDIYGRFIRRGAAEGSLTRLGKVCSLCLLAVLVWLAIELESSASLVDLLDRKFDLLVQLAPAFMLGIRWRGLRGGPAFAGVLAGLGVVGALLAAPGLLEGGKLWGFHPGLYGLVVNLAVAVGGSLRASARPVTVR